MANTIKFKQVVEKREAPIFRDVALVPVRAAVCWGPGAPALRVLIAIAACINNDGFACISFGQIAAVTRLDRRSIPSLMKAESIIVSLPAPKLPLNQGHEVVLTASEIGDQVLTALENRIAKMRAELERLSLKEEALA